MSRWFRFYDDAINHPKALKLSDRLYRTWVGLLCVASKNDGQLPSMEDCALLLRMQPERMAEALVSLVGARLLDRDGAGSLAPHNWDSANSRVTFQPRGRNVTGNVTVTSQRRPQIQNRTEQNRTDSEAVTALIEVSDEGALAAWDAYGLATTGKAFPRNRRGGWCFPTKWPPGHLAEIRPIGRTTS